MKSDSLLLEDFLRWLNKYEFKVADFDNDYFVRDNQSIHYEMLIQEYLKGVNY